MTFSTSPGLQHCREAARSSKAGEFIERPRFSLPDFTRIPKCRIPL